MKDWLIDWLIDSIEFYAVLAIFQPCNGGKHTLFEIKKEQEVNIQMPFPGLIKTKHYLASDSYCYIINHCIILKMYRYYHVSWL